LTISEVEAGVNAKIKKGHIDILRNEHFQQMMWGDKITFSMSKQTIFNTLRDDKQELWGRTGQSTFDRWIKTDDAKMLYFFLATRKKRKRIRNFNCTKDKGAFSSFFIA
jgi:hypothetical protein